MRNDHKEFVTFDRETRTYYALTMLLLPMTARERGSSL